MTWLLLCADREACTESRRWARAHDLSHVSAARSPAARSDPERGPEPGGRQTSVHCARAPSCALYEMQAARRPMDHGWMGGSRSPGRASPARAVESGRWMGRELGIGKEGGWWGVARKLASSAVATSCRGRATPTYARAARLGQVAGPHRASAIRWAGK